MKTQEKAKRRRARGQSGFTLMELLIVIAIIGILAALVGPNLFANLGRAERQAAKAQIANFKTALTAYKIEFKKFPTTGEGLDALVSNQKRNFLDAAEVPKDPWNNPYIYTSPGKHGSPFEIVSYGADGAPGGEGDAADIESWNLQAND